MASRRSGHEPTGQQLRIPRLGPLATLLRVGTCPRTLPARRVALRWLRCTVVGAQLAALGEFEAPPCDSWTIPKWRITSPNNSQRSLVSRP